MLGCVRECTLGVGPAGLWRLLGCEEGLEVECWVWEGRVIRAWDLGAICYCVFRVWGRGAYFIKSGGCVNIIECRSGVGEFSRRIGWV